MKIIIVLMFLLSYPLFSQIVVNEAMPDPPSDEPEWFELYNFSDEPFECIDCLIYDAVGSKALPYFELNPQSYGVITSDSAGLKAAREIPVNALLIETPLPIFNNTTDIIKITKNKNVVDSVFYNMKWGKKGKSIERIDYASPAISSDNWGTSESPNGATAGYKNSISLLDFDIAIDSIIYEKTSNSIVIFILNKGRKRIKNFEFSLKIDLNRDSVFSTTETVYHSNFNDIDTNPFPITISKKEIFPNENSYGSFTALAIVHSELDQNSKNDTLKYILFNAYPQNILTISEIMFDVDANNAEFVEIYNNSLDTINLSGYGISDRWKSHGPDFVYFSKNSLILPRNYAVIAWDSLFFKVYPELLSHNSVSLYKSSFNLNKTGDDIILFDPNGYQIDSLTCKESWHIKGITTLNVSLERISPLLETNSAENWSSCGDARGATPMEKNSISNEITSTGELNVSPNPFSPGKRGNDSHCIVSYSLPYQRAVISAYIFDTSGRRLRKLKTSEPTASKGNFVWDGSNDEGYTLQSGPYVLFFEAVDLASNKVFSKKVMVVIGN